MQEIANNLSPEEEAILMFSIFSVYPTLWKENQSMFDNVWSSSYQLLIESRRNNVYNIIRR
jgi:hypothetical protein